MRIALVGQPNSGKSTLFNYVGGYKAQTGNFSGTTVTFLVSKIFVLGEIVEIIDLPGTYSLAGTNPAERVTLDYLISNDIDVIINVIDVTQLEASLVLTLELLELQLPMVLALNMMDEANRLGLSVDGKKLQELLGLPVQPLVASKGRGIRSLFVAAYRTGQSADPPKRFIYRNDIEEVIKEICLCLDGRIYESRKQTIAIKLLEGEEIFHGNNHSELEILQKKITSIIGHFEEASGQKGARVLAQERVKHSEGIIASVLKRGVRKTTLRDRIDDILLHPIYGYFALILILVVFFEFVYGIGHVLEIPLLELFNYFDQLIFSIISPETLFGASLQGALQGIAGGLAIVFPYLIPFLLGLGFMEDIGYLPRIAYLMDTFMNKIGLHGKAIVPFILGYGCNVPAVMSTRMLDDRRERFLAAALSTLVPCAARVAVIFGLVAFYLGPTMAVIIYFFNLLVIAITGRVLSGLLPEETPGLILEMPPYRMPAIRSIFHKTRFRLKEFVIEAWPILIIGSVILAVMIFFSVDSIVNTILRPITWMLGLPAEVGLPLIFGVVRKELSLIMLYQALGVKNITLAFNAIQMITYTVFIVFYIPCLATIMVLKRELGTRDMVIITGLTVLIAMAAALIARIAASIFLL